jgi:hypothetical protein
MQNISAGTASTGSIAAPGYSISGGSCSGFCFPFTGSTAEWIMERPTYGGVIYDLANFGSAVIGNPVAFESGSLGSVSPRSPALTVKTDITDLIDMYNAGTKLSTSFYNLFDGSGSIGFKWLAYH